MAQKDACALQGSGRPQALHVWRAWLESTLVKLVTARTTVSSAAQDSFLILQQLCASTARKALTATMVELLYADCVHVIRTLMPLDRQPALTAPWTYVPWENTALDVLEDLKRMGPVSNVHTKGRIRCLRMTASTTIPALLFVNLLTRKTARQVRSNIGKGQYFVCGSG